ncbi:MAG: hypothetical protein PHC53_02635 [Patescibacteria group bacterium]|nr:hypothetical protein [Patescibacteria group bacterium]
MTPAELAAYVRKKTGTNATTLVDADILIYANVHMDDIAKEIAKTHRGFFGREFTYNLVGDQRAYDTELTTLNGIRSVEAKIDGTNWKVLTPADLVSLEQPSDETSIKAKFSGQYRYEIWQKKIYIYCGEAIIAVTSGLKVRCDIYPKHLSGLSEATDDMSKDPTATDRGFPRAVHELLARRIVIDWKESKDKPIPLTQTEQKYEYDLAKAIAALRDSNQDEEIVVATPYNDGSQY